MRNPIPGADDITRQVLPNGITVLVRENFEAQSVVISGSLPAGAVYETPEQYGLAELTADALLRGTTQYDFGALHEILESAGMNLEAESGNFLMGFGGKALGDDFPTLIHLLGDVLQRPSFPEQHIDLIKAETITSLRYSEQDSRYRAKMAARQLLYPSEHVYSRDTSGTLETVRHLSAEDCQDFHRQYYSPSDMIVVVVGAIEAQAAIDSIAQAFGDWPASAPQAYKVPDTPHLDSIKQQQIALPGKSQVDIVLGVVGPERRADDFQTAAIANNILGLFGMYGRLGATIREEKGLAYYVYSSVDGGITAGPWRIVAGVDPENVRETIESIRAEVTNFAPTASEIDDTKANFKGKLPLKLESNEGVAGHILSMERYGLGLDYLRNYATMVDGITAEEIQQVVRDYWRPDAFVMTVAGPEVAL